jgi:hypothetical protein
VRAILVASRPGQRGSQAVAEVLLGRTNPSGKLADAWPLAVGHLGAPGQPMQQLANGEWQLLPSAAAMASSVPSGATESHLNASS